MFNRIRQVMGNRRFGGITLAVVCFSFLLGAGGFSIAQNFHREDNMVQMAATPQAMPASFADLANRLSPTVVNVKVTGVEKIFNPFLDQQEKFPVQGAGSGVIIDKTGYILTNNHVVGGATEVTVTMADKQEYKAKVVGTDPLTDLAVIKIEPKESLTAAALGSSDQLQVGDWVLAIGNPFGLNNTVTAGIVSAKGRVIGAGPYDDFIQTDAPINPGNSGGPLFNMRGELVGINAAIVPNGQGIGFSIPIDEAKPLIPQLESKGQVTRGYLGVNIQAITPEIGKALKLETQKGALVSDVMPGTPAEKAGIQRGDVVIAYNREAVEGPRDLSLFVAKTPVGNEVTITLMREGAKKEIAARIGKLGSEEAAIPKESTQSSRGKWGLYLQDQVPGQPGVPGTRGAVVVNVQPGSPADHAGILQGDAVIGVNNQPVSSAKEAIDAISKVNGEKDPLLLLVKRGQGTFFAALTM